MAETEVQSEVAGTVWKVHVKPGYAVKSDQELMILESMKTVSYTHLTLPTNREV